MSGARHRLRADLFHGAHVVHGGVLLVNPAAPAARLGGRPADRPTIFVVRMLGVRHLVQGLAGLAAPQSVSPALGAAVDTAHALSMVVLAVLDRGHRRAAGASALVAGAFALAGRWASRRG